MELVLMLIAGILIGIALSMIGKRHERPCGCLRVDHSDPDGPYIFLELYESVERLSERKEALVEVKIQDYVSHK